MSGFWVFGYGSLMWRPGFVFAESAPARLAGAHRALCVYSWVHRGTREKPGLVLGLDRGGSCRGVAFRVGPGEAEATLAYLRAREQVTGVYREAWRPVRLHGRRASDVLALCYIVDRNHPQYAGDLPRERQLELVRDSAGESGANRDYVLGTVAHLRALGVRDERLEWLAARLTESGAALPAGEPEPAHPRPGDDVPE
jgi:cation transport protein ChaC